MSEVKMGCHYCKCPVIYASFLIHHTRVELCHMCAADASLGLAKVKEPVRAADVKPGHHADLIRAHKGRPINDGTYTV